MRSNAVKSSKSEKNKNENYVDSTQTTKKLNKFIDYIYRYALEFPRNVR